MLKDWKKFVFCFKKLHSLKKIWFCSKLNSWGSKVRNSNNLFCNLFYSLILSNLWITEINSFIHLFEFLKFDWLGIWKKNFWETFSTFISHHFKKYTLKNIVFYWTILVSNNSWSQQIKVESRSNSSIESLLILLCVFSNNDNPSRSTSEITSCCRGSLSFLEKCFHSILSNL